MFANPGKGAKRRQGMPAQIEKVVTGIDFRPVEDGREYLDNVGFKGTPVGFFRCFRYGADNFRRRKRSAVQLAVNGQRKGRQADKP